MKLTKYLKEHYVKLTLVCSSVLFVISIIAIIFAFCVDKDKQDNSLTEKDIHVFINQDDSTVFRLQKSVDLLNQKIDEMNKDTVCVIIQH